MALIKCRACGSEISKTAKPCPKCGEKRPRRTSLLAVIFGACFWTCVIFIVLPDLMRANTSSSSTTQVSPKEAAIGSMKLDFTWRKDGFGSVMIADFTVHNNGLHDVKDVEVKCIHSAPSGTVIDSNTQTLYDLFKAKSTRQIRDFNMGFIHSQAAITRCEITDLTVL